MFVSIGHKLRGLGNVRVGFRMKGSTGCFFLCLYWCINALIYLMWYSLLATFWLMYGVCYLFFYLPIKGIIKLCKKKQVGKKIADAARKYTQAPQPTPSEEDEASRLDTNSLNLK